jgi:hypothetical protein
MSAPHAGAYWPSQRLMVRTDALCFEILAARSACCRRRIDDCIVFASTATYNFAEEITERLVQNAR